MMKINKLIQFQILLIITALFSLTTLAKPLTNSHTFHTSLTRIDYNAEQHIFEISIQLFTHDLIPMLEKQTGKQVDLDKNDADKAIFDYLNNTFVLFNKTGEAKKLEWIGKEVDTDTAWIYLETPSTEGLNDFRLQNTIFFESFPEQTNLVICRFENQKSDLMFKVGDKVKNIAPNNLKEITKTKK